MHRFMLMGLILALAECGVSEPSNKEIAQGMMRTFIRESGVQPSNFRTKAKKIGDGRWAVSMEVEQYGERRTLNATAIMDKNGDIHYYADRVGVVTCRAQN